MLPNRWEEWGGTGTTVSQPRGVHGDRDQVVPNSRGHGLGGTDGHTDQVLPNLGGTQGAGAQRDEMLPNPRGYGGEGTW